jgi:hypothetical protein
MLGLWRRSNGFAREHTENRDETDAKIDESRPRKLRGSEALVAGSWFAFAWAI